MATEEQKKENLIRVLEMTIQGLAKGLFELFGESSYAVMYSVGEEMMGILQKEMGLELGGEDGKAIAQEIARLFVDEIGLATKIDVDHQGNVITLTAHNHRMFNQYKRMSDNGVKEPFVDPLLNVGAAVIAKRRGRKPSISVELLPEIRGIKITWKVLS